MSASGASGEGRRLLFVVNVLWFFLSHRFQLAVAARRQGYDVHVAAGGATAAEISRLTDAGVTFHPLNLRRSGRGVLANLSLVLALTRLYGRLKPDIVHHVTIKPVMLGTFAARRARITAVVNAVSGLGYAFTDAAQSRSFLRRLLTLGYRICLRHPRMVFIFQNGADRAELTRVAALDPVSTRIIAGSGVDLREFAPSAEPPEPVRVVLPARMLRDKGVVEFAESIAALKSRGFKIEGLLAGGLDPENPAGMSEAQIRVLEQTTHVRWLGHQAEMPKVLRNAHIVCLPSYREGLPKALIEASAAQRPIVTTDVPGCRDVVTDGVEGLLVPARDAAALADALAVLAADRALRQSMGEAARARAEREFSLGHVIDATLSVYQQLFA